MNNHLRMSIGQSFRYLLNNNKFFQICETVLTVENLIEVAPLTVFNDNDVSRVVNDIAIVKSDNINMLQLPQVVHFPDNLPKVFSRVSIKLLNSEILPPS